MRRSVGFVALWLKDHRQHYPFALCDTLTRIGEYHEKAVSRKRSAGRVELGPVGGIRCRKAGAGICTTAAASACLHLDRLLHWWERGLGKRNEQPYHGWQ